MADYCVYILYSKEIDKFYIGETEDLDQRIKFHLKKEFSNSFTRQANDWIVYYTISCSTRKQARLIETHIKKMKSRTYLVNLKKYPKITQKLLDQYIN